MGIATVALIYTIVGLLIFVVSVPLIFGKVPMNRFYGIRIPSAFKSDQSWYESNAYGGRKMALWSWLITVTGVAGLFLPPNYLSTYALAGAGIALVAGIAPLIQVVIWSRRRHKS